MEDKSIEFIQQLLSGLSLGAVYALIALGYTMVFGVLRFINFAHGDILMLGAFAAFWLNTKITPIITRLLGSPDPNRELSRWEQWLGPHEGLLGLGVILILVMLGCTIFGMIVEFLCYRPLRNRPRITVLITAIGVSLFIENFGQYLFGVDPRLFEIMPDAAIELPEATWGKWSALTVMRGQVLVFVVTFLLLISLTLLVKRTKIGMAMRALSLNPTACTLMGVNVSLVISFTFGLGSALGGAGGVLYAMQYPSIEPLMGILPGLKAFVAAVLGGIGNLAGAVLGGLLIGVLEYMVIGYGASTYRDAVVFGILIAILLLRPQGLLGKNVREKV